MKNPDKQHEEPSKGRAGSGDYMPARHSQYGTLKDPYPVGSNENYGMKREQVGSPEDAGGEGGRRYGGSNRFSAQSFPTDQRARQESNLGHSGHPDADYHQWRDEQISNFDRDYGVYRQERFKKFAGDFEAWRSDRVNRVQPNTENPAAAHAQPQSHSQDGQPSPLLAGRLDSGVKK